MYNFEINVKEYGKPKVRAHHQNEAQNPTMIG